MVIRFDRKSLPDESPDKAHYNGFIVPNDAVFSELLALLPERSDVLSVRGVLWKIVAAKNGAAVGYIAVDTEGAYTTGLLGPDQPIKTIPAGIITALPTYRGNVTLRDMLMHNS